MLRLLVYLLIDPVTWIIGGVLWLWWVQKRTSWLRYKIYWGVYLLFFYLVTTPFVSNQLVENWERQYPVLEVENLDPTLDYHLLVFGAGAAYDTTLPNTSRLSLKVMARLMEGIRLYHLLPHATLVTSANSPSGRTPQAVTVKRAAVELGIPEEDIYPQIEPWNTQTEAETFVKRFGKEQPVVLVTAAVHMPRAMSWIKYYGAEQVWAAPCDYNIKHAHDDPFNWKTLIPSISRTEKYKSYIKERLGIIQVRLYTRTM